MNNIKIFLLTATISFFLVINCNGQETKKIIFDNSDSISGYYLGIPPSSGTIRGVLLLCCPYRGPESMIPETRLHSVAAANDLLTIYASTGNRIVPAMDAMEHLNTILKSVTTNYPVDKCPFAMGGYDLAGMSVLRFAEMAGEEPNRFVIQPKAVFSIASFVDLQGYYNSCQRLLKKNYFPPAVNDAKASIARLEKEIGKPGENAERYAGLTPFNNQAAAPGNEKFLLHTAVRAYYDTDIEWQLKFRRNSYYDTYLVDGSELIARLLLEGNNKAEFVATRSGVRSNGSRNASSLSIVDEVDCIQWIKKELHIFSPDNPFAYSGPYHFMIPDGWRTERTAFPPPFAPQVKLHGIEEIRFPPGWGVAGSEDYWSVAYLFWLDAGQPINENTLQDILKTYYDGLVITGGGPVPHNIPKEKMIDTKVIIRKIKPDADDIETWSGTVHMLDYMTMKPMTLNFKVHTKQCGDKDHFPLFLELSPRPFTDVLWIDLEKMKKNFTCED